MTTTTGRRRLPTAERREAILAAALELFGRSGYDAVGMREVAASCNLSAAGIYRHFENKEALLLGIFDILSDRIVAAMRDASRADTPRLVLTRLIRFHVRMVLAEPALVPIWEHQEGALPEAERGRIRHLLRDYQSAWTEALRALDPSLSPEVARVTVVATFGTMNNVPLHKSSLPSRALEKLTIELAWRTMGQPAGG
jgi:AcrR family transcriptional regulator